MAEEAATAGPTLLQQIVRWAGALLFAGSLLFLLREAWRLEWSSLDTQLSYQLAGGAALACALFYSANVLLARAWVRLADPEEQVAPARLVQIYASSVWLKYLPGSVFHYLGRHAQATQLGLGHSALARSHGSEIALHLVASLAAAAACLAFDKEPVMAAIATGVVVMACVAIGKPLAKALLFQLLAFGAFALAAYSIGWVVLPEGANLMVFAALFLLAWLIGFLVPVAPGGLGVREAALLALTSASLPSEEVLAALLVLRLSSIAADLAYGMGALRRARQKSD